MQPSAARAGHGFIRVAAFARLSFGNPNPDVRTRPGTEDRGVGHRTTLRVRRSAALICLKRRRFPHAFPDLPSAQRADRLPATLPSNDTLLAPSYRPRSANDPAPETAPTTSATEPTGSEREPSFTDATLFLLVRQHSYSSDHSEGPELPDKEAARKTPFRMAQLRSLLLRLGRRYWRCRQ